MTENTLETVSETEFLVSGRSMRLLTGISFGTVGDGYRVVWIVASRWRHRPARMSEGRWDVEGRGGQQERNPVEAKPGNGGGRKKKNREKKSSGMATLAPLVKMAWTNRCHLWCVGPAVAPCPVCAVSRARASVGRCFLLFFFSQRVPANRNTEYRRVVTKKKYPRRHAVQTVHLAASTDASVGAVAAQRDGCVPPRIFRFKSYWRLLYGREKIIPLLLVFWTSLSTTPVIQSVLFEARNLWKMSKKSNLVSILPSYLLNMIPDSLNLWGYKASFTVILYYGW